MSDKVLNIKDLDFRSPIETIINNNSFPPKFKDCTFDNYVPDREYPSQQSALDKLKEFVCELIRFKRKRPKNNLLRKLFIIRKPKNIYLDGAFGVGKTHLLAAVGNSYPGRKVFLSFSELMYLIAHYTLLDVVNMLTNQFDLILLDEFELDDPGDAMTGINFIRETNKTDSVIVTTSNALPTELGKRKLDILVFKERIGSLIEAFDTIIIDGKDYRVKMKSIDLNEGKRTLKDLFYEYRPKNRYKMYLDFEELIGIMRQVHPVRYSNFSYKLDAIFIENLRPFKESELLDALRFTYLIDTIYYGDVEIYATSQVDIWHLFYDDLRDGKFRAKIGRCISRLSEKCLLIKK